MVKPVPVFLIIFRDAFSVTQCTLAATILNVHIATTLISSLVTATAVSVIPVVLNMPDSSPSGLHQLLYAICIQTGDG